MMRREVTEPHWWDQTNLHWSVTQQIKKYGSVGSATTLNHPDVIIVLFVSTFESKFSLLNMYIWWYTKNGRFIVSFMHLILGGRCILKMDHHCVWVVNCVGALNYKYFLLFLVC